MNPNPTFSELMDRPIDEFAEAIAPVMDKFKRRSTWYHIMWIVPASAILGGIMTYFAIRAANHKPNQGKKR